jgi:peptidoglycan/xylan/chitin deacetylase (PgdA/CDA1 family)
MIAPRIPILLYHQVLPQRYADAIGSTSRQPRFAVGVDRFRNDMTRLHRGGWRTIPATEAAEQTLSGQRRRRVFAITFDDATRDFGELAHPVLRDLGFTATVFVVAGKVGGHADWSKAADVPLLATDELRDLAREGVTLGSHSLHHRYLPECSDSQLRTSLRQSRIIIADIVGHEVTTLAWPYGAHDDRCRRAAVEAGYRLGYAVAGDGSLLARSRQALLPTARDHMAIARREVRGTDSPIRRRLRMGPIDGLFVTARKLGTVMGAG